MAAAKANHRYSNKENMNQKPIEDRFYNARNDPSLVVIEGFHQLRAEANRVFQRVESLDHHQ